MGIHFYATFIDLKKTFDTIGFVGHLRARCTNHITTATGASVTAPAPTCSDLTTVALKLRAPPPSITATSTISAIINAATMNINTSTTLVTDQSTPDASSGTSTSTIIAPPTAMWTRS
nr:unnamed protein product [Spirometra erinaceieuropaei]